MRKKLLHICTNLYAPHMCQYQIIFIDLFVELPSKLNNIDLVNSRSTTLYVLCTHYVLHVNKIIEIT